MEALVARCFEGGGPDVLLTHAPPAGVLDDDRHGARGVPELAARLARGGHNVRHHLFGHVHARGGETLVRDGVRYVNGARCARAHDIV